MEIEQIKEIEKDKFGEIFREKDGNYIFICYHCGEQFRLASGLIYHIEVTHLTPSLTDDFNDNSEFLDAGEIFIKSECLDADEIFIKSVFLDDKKIFFKSITENTVNSPAPLEILEDFLSCDYCDEQIRGKKLMESHILLLHAIDDEPFQCNLCRQTFKLKHLMDGHKKILHGIEIVARCGVVCIYCSTKLPDEKSYDQHVKNYHIKYVCDHCGSKYNQKKNLIKHMREKHESKTFNKQVEFKCTVYGCGLIFNSAKKLRAHNCLIRTREKSFICDLCQMGFYTDQALALHKQKVHKTGQMYQCAKCGNISAYSYCLKSPCYKYKNKTSEKDKKHQCPDCGRKFLLYESLSKHKINNKCRSICDICSKEFKNKKTMREHQKNMHSTKVIQCRYCSMTFLKTTSRMNHEIKHKKGLIKD